MTKQVPFNTGKVLIGCRYEPVKHTTTTLTEEFWQSILLNDDTHLRRCRVQTIFDMAAIAILGPVIGFVGALLIVWASTW
jgi:hypothetical protein